MPLNDSQLKAIHVICNSCGGGSGSGGGGGGGGYQGGGGLHLIQGPPGTGKTHFLVALLATLLCLGQEEPGPAQGPGLGQEQGKGLGQGLEGGEGQEPTKTKAVSDEEDVHSTQAAAAAAAAATSIIRLMVCAPSNKAVSMALEKFLFAAADSALYGLVRVALVGVEEKMDECSATSNSNSNSNSNSHSSSKSQDNGSSSNINNNISNKFDRKRKRDEPEAQGPGLVPAQGLGLGPAQGPGLGPGPGPHSHDEVLSSQSSLPSYVAHPLNRLLRPQSSSDVFVYTYR